MDDAFWADFDTQIVANRPDDSGEPQAAAILKGASVLAETATDAVAFSPSRTGSDWSGVLDTLTAAKSAAQRQEARLREQAVQQLALLEELKRTQQEVRVFETLLREVRAQADTKMEELQARVEAIVRDLQAEATRQLQAMEVRARAAEARAESAEDWLKRIEQASRALLPVEQQAAA